MEINPSYKKVFPCWGPVSKHPMAGVGLREEITFGTFCCASTETVEEVAIAIATAVVMALRGGILRILVLVVIVVVIVRVVYSRV